MQPEETQAEPEAEDAFHHATIARAREEVHGKAIPQRCGEGRILVLPSPHRDPGERFDALLPSSFLFFSFFCSNTTIYILILNMFLLDNRLIVEDLL